MARISSLVSWDQKIKNTRRPRELAAGVGKGAPGAAGGSRSGLKAQSKTLLPEGMLPAQARSEGRSRGRPS